MKNKVSLPPVFISLMVFLFLSCKDDKSNPDKNEENTDSVSQTEMKLDLDMSDTGIKIQPTMYGVFFEDINFAADGGLYAEMVKNRSFEFTLPKMGWKEPESNRHSLNSESGFLSPVKYKDGGANSTFGRVEVKGSKYVLINEGYRGMGVKENAKYNLSLKAKKRSGNINSITFQLVDSLNTVLAESAVQPNSDAWKTYNAELTASKTELKAQLKITFEGTGVIDLDMISMFPQDTWKGRKNGLRKDLVQLLDDLNPGFLRFPGGCIVEGRTLERRYQWKKTIGDVEDREILVNRWNTEFMHKFTPDYYQSFGLGFFEYFQLSEDLGAEPLPILSCGIACQFNTGELVPLEELDPYVQDALDLIQFANGDISTYWGKLRADMGHPEPFNMKYIGIGNEQWGPAYIERHKIFHEAIKSVYPEMIIVSGSGPFPDGDYFEYGWEQLKEMNAEIVDEHYYRPPTWFLENAGRYDDYDRSGPKVFAGEYAGHPKGVDNGITENNWQAALSEAAFMTGLERNADIVTLTSYAPLMAHADAWQWAPDLIWFNNLDVVETPNYKVQKLFSTNPGTDVLSITENNKPLIGQNNVYASAVKDVNTNEIIIKIINTNESPQKVFIDLKDSNLKNTGTITILQQDDLKAYNSFENPDSINTITEDIKIENSTIDLNLKDKSVNMIKIKL